MMKKVRSEGGFEVYNFSNPRALSVGELSFLIDENASIVVESVKRKPLSNSVFSGQTGLVTYGGIGVSESRKVKNAIFYPVQKLSDGSYEVVTQATIRVPKLSSPSFTSKAKKSVPGIFASGTWYKIPILRDGIHVLDSQYLQSLGINVSSIDPRNIEIWMGNGYMLAHPNATARPNFQQVRILVEGESDGSFDANDRIIFYQNGPQKHFYNDDLRRWDFELHRYSTQNYVFLRIDGANGWRLLDVPANQGQIVDQSERLIWKEEELYKSEADIKSGTEWYGQRFTTAVSSASATILNDTLPDWVPNAAGFSSVTLIGRSLGVSSNMKFFVNGQGIGETVISSIAELSSIEGVSGISRTFFGAIEAGRVANGILAMQGDFSHPTSTASAFIDQIKIWYPSNFTAERGRLEIQRPPSSSVERYLVQGFSSQPLAFDITNPLEPQKLHVTTQGANYVVSSVGNGARRLVVQNSFLRPQSGGLVVSQNIRELITYPQMVIVTSEELLVAAQEFADYRSQKSNMNITIVTQNQIFNEFSSGVPDFVAIRDYLRYVYQQAPSLDQRLKYGLFFGDATYDYKNIEGKNGAEVLKNHVFTYQTRESLHREFSFGSDDFFGLLDENEGAWRTNIAASEMDRVDIGLGRFPVQTVSEARAMIEKIKMYESAESQGSWRSIFTYVSDDDVSGSKNDEDLHLINADVSSQFIDTDNSGVRVKKIHMLSYTPEITTVGRRFPQATNDLIETINEGSLVINYSGHGDEQLLADERLFESDMISRFTNAARPSIFVTATCSFGRFDDAFGQSGAEKTVLHPNGGMIAALTTTRVVYTSPTIGNNNFGLNIAISRIMSSRDDDGKPFTMGEIFRQVKNESPAVVVNGRKFILLGDPSMRLGLPEQTATLEDVNEIPLANSLSLKALDRVMLTGNVLRNGSQLDVSFNGEAEITVYDGSRFVPYPEKSWVDAFCPNDDCGYFIQNDILFRGRATLENGAFQSNFILPKDLNFSGRTGRIHAYAKSETSDAVASFSDVTFSGTNPNAINDGRGPIIRMYLNDESFSNGMLVNPSPTLIVRLQDDSGINTTGSGVGHELMATLNTVPERNFILNEFYDSELNDFTRGGLEFDFPDLPSGTYSLRLRAWDVFNNVNEESVDFVVANTGELEIVNLYNYPNPMSMFTNFVFEHNQEAGQELDVLIRIYTLSGRPIAQIVENIISVGNIVQIPWYGRDNDNAMVANGTYLYSIRVRGETENGKSTAENIERLVIIR